VGIVVWFVVFNFVGFHHIKTSFLILTLAREIEENLFRNDTRKSQLSFTFLRTAGSLCVCQLMASGFSCLPVSMDLSLQT